MSEHATSASNLLLAVDGGQSHSVAVIAHEDGCVLGAGKGGPANHFLEAGGQERFLSSMKSCVLGAFSDAGLQPQRVSAAHYCLTGVHPQMAPILQSVVPTLRQSIQPDRVASLWGASSARPVVLILSGTGSIAYGLDTTGHEAVSGGWGYAMGDEGSGSWIGLRALSAATQAVDGRGPYTTLTSLIPDYYGIHTLQALHPLIYTHQIDRVRLAEITRVVTEAAQQGDVISTNILAEAARYLANAVTAVIRTMKLEGQTVTVTSSGGVFKAGALVIDPLMSSVYQSYPNAHYVPPKYPPVIGALILAMQSFGIPLTQSIHANIKTTSHIWQTIK